MTKMNQWEIKEIHEIPKCVSDHEQTLEERALSLLSEYKAYHLKSDYWRGIEYALNCLGMRTKEDREEE